MKRILTIAVLIMMLAVPCFAQWGGAIAGDTIKHREGIDVGEVWWSQMPLHATGSSLELAGYNSVRADYDISGIEAEVNVNIQCSNDSLWVSGDSITISEDTYASYDLSGCKDYNWFVESVDGTSASIDIYVTPYNE